MYLSMIVLVILSLKETYSGHAPGGEYILELFEKIEDVIIDTEGHKVSVCRVLVMDSASNSVKTLRAFQSIELYHYITPLDENQWNERKINSIGSPSRYNYFDLTLREVVIELKETPKETPKETYLILSEQ